MRKAYTIDLIMLLLVIACFFGYLFLKNNISTKGLIIYVTFLALQIFINIRFKIVIKYAPKFDPLWKEYLGLFFLFIGKIQFLLVLLNNTTWLYWSVVHFGIMSLFLLDYSYISEDNIVHNLNKIIDIENIKNIEINSKLLSTVYINGYLTDHKEIKFKLAEEEYQYLQNEIK